MKNRLASLVIALSALALAFSARASAEPMNPRSWGARIGYRFGEHDFDQMVLGLHGDLGDLTTNLRFEPNFSIGFGSNANVYSINPDLQYVFRDTPLSGGALFYLGGGPAIHILDFHEHDDSEDFTAGPDESETQVKVNLVAGFEAPPTKKVGFFGEMRITFVDGTWFDLLGGINVLP